MKQKSKKGLLAAVVLSTATITGQPVQAENIGNAERVISGADQSAPGSMDWQEINLDDFVISDQQLRTDAGGRLHIRFVDNTTLTLGPNSQMTLDKFVYDPNSGNAEMAVSLGKGIARVIGGQATRFKPVVVKTKTATMGIRGGIGLFQAGEDGSSAATLVYGELSAVDRYGRGASTTDSDSSFFFDSMGNGSGPLPSGDRSLSNLLPLLERPSGMRPAMSEDQIARQLQNAGLGTDDLNRQTGDDDDTPRDTTYQPPLVGLGKPTATGDPGSGGFGGNGGQPPVTERACQMEVVTLCLDPAVDAAGDAAGNVN